MTDPLPANLRNQLGQEAPDEALLLEGLEGPVAGQTYRLTGLSSFFVGRGAAVHLAIVGDEHLSRVHFCIEYKPPQAQLSDCGSKNGTYLNQQRLVKNAWVSLVDGDLIRAGDLLLRVRLPGGEGATLTFSASERSEASGLSKDSGQGMPVIPGYVLEEKIGHGGMGVVYRARRDGTPVAIKTVLPALSPHLETQVRFQREISILQSLVHPNIVRFHEAGIAAGLVYFVMEYVEGPSAAQLLKQAGPLPTDQVIELGCQLLDALAHAHECGFVHRDIKPGNLLLSGPPGRVMLKLSDFGLAKAYQESRMSGLTMTGQAGGTPMFMPPEQVRDFREAGPAADQYSTAATLYYLATGDHIYERAQSTLELMARILQEEPLPLRPGAQHPALAEALRPVLCRALRRKPEERYPDVRAMRRALRDT